MIDDAFEIAMRLDSVLNAWERRTLGYMVHRAVDVRHLVAIAKVFEGSLAQVRAQTQYDRIVMLSDLIDALNDDKQGYLTATLDADAARNPWRAMRGNQSIALERAMLCDLLMLAGGAGSGKTDTAIAIAIYLSRAARFLRKTSLEFAAIYKRMGEIIGNTAGRNMSTHTWELPPPYGWQGKGCVVEFNSLAEPDSMLRLQGRPVDTLIVDDVGSGQIPRDDIKFVSRWVRSTERVPLRTVYTSNPPTAQESLWLRDDVFYPWLNKDYGGVRAVSGEVRYFIHDEEVQKGDVQLDERGRVIEPKRRCVMLSNVYDNPRYVRTGYAAELQHGDEIMRKRLLDNDWSAGWDTDDAQQVLSSKLVDEAVARWQPLEEHERPGMDALGCDVARGGADRTTLARKHDWWYDVPLIYPGKLTINGGTVAELVREAHRDNAVVKVDVIGIGASAYDFLDDMDMFATIPVNGSEKAPSTDKTGTLRFLNYRSWYWWRFRELLEEGKIALPPDRMLRQELITPRWSIRGKTVCVESREDIMKRIHRSADVATAYVLAAIDVFVETNPRAVSPAALRQVRKIHTQQRGA